MKESNCIICKRCGAEIKEGSYCPKCKEELMSELKKSLEKINANRLSRVQLIERAIDEIVRSGRDFRGVTLKIQFSNLNNYFKAKSMGAESFSVMIPEGCCPSCKKIYQNGSAIFDIEQVEMIPPLDGCPCIPTFST